MLCRRSGNAWHCRWKYGILANDKSRWCRKVLYWWMGDRKKVTTKGWTVINYERTRWDIVVSKAWRLCSEPMENDSIILFESFLKDQSIKQAEQLSRIRYNSRLHLKLLYLNNEIKYLEESQQIKKSGPLLSAQ